MLKYIKEKVLNYIKKHKKNDEIIEENVEEAIKDVSEEKIESTIYKEEIKNIVQEVKKQDEIEGGNMKKNDIPEISKEIYLLMKRKEFDAAIRLCNEYPDNSNIQSQHIKILLKQQKYEEALKICNLPIFQNNYIIQREKVRILMQSKRYNEASSVIKNPAFKNNKEAQKLAQEISMYSVTDEQNKIIGEVYTRIYLDTITLDEINNSDIEEFKKLILKILYHEKRKLPSILKEIKAAKKQYADDKEKVKILNEFQIKFESKKFMYLNYSIYTSILGTTLCDEMIEKHNNEKQYEFKQTKKVVVEQIKPVKKVEIKEFKQANKVVVEKIKETEIVRKPKEKNKVHSNSTTQVKKEKKPINLENVKIKDVFDNEVFEIQKYLYVQMNLDQTRKTADLWDRFSVLIDKSVSDYSALSRFVQIATIINNNSLYTNIDIDNLNNKKLRYTNKSI